MPRPSTADSTLMAGVITPSPYSSAAPMSTSRVSAETPCSFLPIRSGTSASRARIPPSPWLSARMMNARYLTVTTIINDQKMSERTPRTSALALPEPCSPLTHWLRV